ncbi:hypothetical protein [Acutalibacter sp. JLR.KK004]|uniref:hypothetical protein n=1 Tax=Acutalibacter sp. JLR.KK004 TaxID=3112622 RepID=UPI002FF39416
MYKTLEEIPSKDRYIFEKLVTNGIISADDQGRINIGEEMYRMILILARLGLLPEV